MSNEERLSHVHPALAAKVRKLLELAAAEGHQLVVVQGLRTFAEQDALYRQRPRVTNARAGQSMHNYGLACDLAFVVDGKVSWDDKLYPAIGRWASAAGLEWGGTWRTFKDLPHVQLKGLPSWSTLLPIYRSGGLAAVWQKFRG
jgi:peptidoglycan L-alanyl-D-glutamate endopeptidase CwlK